MSDNTEKNNQIVLASPKARKFAGELGVNVKNIVGQDLIETSPNAKDFELDFSTLPSGGYFLKLTSGNNTKILRIIVE